MDKIKNIALVAHDEMKKDLMEWAKNNHDKLNIHNLYGTGTTGSLLKSNCSLNITPLKSGPLGGDLELGAMVANGGLDLIIFFWDPMTAQPHDVDIKALLRIAAVYNIPLACNRSTADFVISSNYFNEEYFPKTKDYKSHINRLKV